MTRKVESSSDHAANDPHHGHAHSDRAYARSGRRPLGARRRTRGGYASRASQYAGRGCLRCRQRRCGGGGAELHTHGLGVPAGYGPRADRHGANGDGPCPAPRPGPQGRRLDLLFASSGVEARWRTPPRDSRSFRDGRLRSRASVTSSRSRSWHVTTEGGKWGDTQPISRPSIPFCPARYGSFPLANRFRLPSTVLSTSTNRA